MRVDDPAAVSAPRRAQRAATAKNGKGREGEETGGDGHERIAIGYVVRPKGVRGEAVVEPLTGDVGRFDDVEEVILERSGQPPKRLRIAGWRLDGRGILMKFTGIDSPETVAEEVAKGYLTIPRDEVPEPPEGTIYVFDLVGCRVEDEGGNGLGEVVGVQEMPTADLLVVRNGQREVLIPLVGDFVLQVLLAEHRVVVTGVEELVPLGTLVRTGRDRK